MSKHRSKKSSRFEADEVDPSLDFDADDSEGSLHEEDDDIGEDDKEKVKKLGLFNRTTDAFVKNFIGGPAKVIYTKSIDFLSYFKTPIYYGWIPLILYFGIRNAGRGQTLKRALSIAIPVMYIDPAPDQTGPNMYLPGGQQAPQGYDDE